MAKRKPRKPRKPCADCGDGEMEYEDPREGQSYENDKSLCFDCFQNAAEERLDEIETEVQDLELELKVARAQKKKPSDQCESAFYAIGEDVTEFFDFVFDKSTKSASSVKFEQYTGAIADLIREQLKNRGLTLTPVKD